MSDLRRAINASLGDTTIPNIQRVIAAQVEIGAKLITDLHAARQSMNLQMDEVRNVIRRAQATLADMELYVASIDAELAKRKA